MPKIALIEDNEDNRMLIVAFLESEPNLEVIEYEDGSAALAGLPNDPPDLILLDISLPGMDGLEVLKTLKGTDLANIPTIALTAHAMEGDREHFLQQGFDAYMSKPIVDDDEFLSLVYQFLPK